MTDFIVEANLSYLWPEIILIVLGLLLLLLEVLLPRGSRNALGAVAVLGVLAAAWSLKVMPMSPEPVLGGMVLSDTFALFFRAVLLVILLMVYLTSVEYVARKGIPAGEFYALLAFATTGALFMAISADLIAFYVGLETLSISSYVLAGLLRDDRSREASLKYFLYGSMASAVMLFGFSLFFGLTGTTNLREIAQTLQSSPAGALELAALILVLAGLAVKAAAVPFHLWAPDTYEGAPTPVTAFLSVASEGAAIAAMLRIFFDGLSPLQGDWTGLFAVVAVLSMTVGNVAALHQTNVKRMLAYSSITQIGYVLAGLAVGSVLGFTAAAFFVLTYAFTNVGAFAILVALANQGEDETLRGVSGLARREPVLAFMMLLFLLSLLGIPPLAGFWAKFFIFRAVVDAGLIWLAIAVALNSAISVGYYYAVVKAMYVTPPEDEVRDTLVSAGIPLQLGLALAAAGVIVLGLWPDTFLLWSEAASLVR